MSKNSINIDLIDEINLGIIIFDNKFEIIRLNNTAINILNTNKSIINFLTLFKININDQFYKLIRQLTKTSNEIIDYELTYNNLYLNLTIKFTEINSNSIYICSLKDITKIKEKEKHLSYRAYYDQLTNLPNRSLFIDRAENALNQAIRSKDKLALLFIDLDGFKKINDKFGHSIGDECLKNFSTRLLECARKSDTVSRIGGDEFTILMPRINSADDAANLASRTLLLTNKKMHIKNNNLNLNASIGIAIFPEDANSVPELLEKADKAMYMSKKNTNKMYIFYNKI